LHYGNSNKIVLESSVVDIKAKKTPTASGVWEMTGVSTDLMTPSNPLIVGNGGENVIVGIIDTGIDWSHENFHELTGDSTRILRIWDQGLTAQSGENTVQPSYTNSDLSYGVEYTKANIDAVLQNTP